MEAKEIKAIFPKKIWITQELIDSKKNIGTELLKSIFPLEIHEDIFWGLSIGNVKSVKIKTEKIVEWQNELITIPFYLDSSIKKPVEITFKLR